ncbi:MAG: hypothetical protein ACPGFB_15505 [Verrucomicrobiales bacterium]
MEKPGKLTVLIGMPGAGKSTRIDNVLEPTTDGMCVHDFQKGVLKEKRFPANSQYLEALIDCLNLGQDCVIADIQFCRKDRREQIIGAIADRVPNLSIEYQCFENDPDRCRANAIERDGPKLERELEKITEITEVYSIPAGAEMLEVSDPDLRAQSG